MIDLRTLELPNRSDITRFWKITEGASYKSNSLAGADDGNDAWIFADTNRDGKLNLETDFAVKFVGARYHQFHVDDFYFV